jgi:hypothetical protein
MEYTKLQIPFLLEWQLILRFLFINTIKNFVIKSSSVNWCKEECQIFIGSFTCIPKLNSSIVDLKQYFECYDTILRFETVHTVPWGLQTIIFVS